MRYCPQKTSNSIKIYKNDFSVEVKGYLAITLMRAFMFFLICVSIKLLLQQSKGK